MITEEHASVALATLVASGLKPPDPYSAPADKATRTPPGRVLTARVYAAALNHAGLTPAELEGAVVEYIAEPQEGQYPKCWPSPGHLVARTAMGRLIATLGTDADADRAWTDLGIRLSHLRCSQRRPAEVFRLPTALDPEEHRHAAMWAGLVVIGGIDGHGQSDVNDRTVAARFRAAYVAARQQQRTDARAVRAILTAAPLLIEAAK
jgi:hypothetical protein